MAIGCSSNKTRKQRGGMVSSPAAFPQGAPWNVETALPGINGNVSDVGNFYKVNQQAGALPDPVSSNNSQCGPCSGGRKRKRRTTRKATKARKSRKGKSKTKRNRKSKTNKKKKGKKNKKARKTRKGRKVSKRKTIKGGSRDTIFQGAVNTWRGTLFGAGDLVNQWSGKPSQLSPAPTDQAPVPDGNVILGEMPDVNAIHIAAGQAVSRI